MRTKKAAVAAFALSVLSISSAWSADKTKTNAGDDWAQHVQRQAAEQARGPASPETPVVARNSQAALFGSPSPASPAHRTITLAPGMKYVNVAAGDTVTFKSGDQQATWAFAELVHGGSVDLGLLLPGMPNAQGVRVYIERSQLFTGG